MLKEPKKNIIDFQEHIVQGISLLSYDELEKVNNYVNSFINNPSKEKE
tara:strand:+ start:672 stop:815 length:144 start_codon:yes stop_codon:yes gene_type:complete